jgi:protein-S-isoprenylcysteine O-methyltransferase Ste14
VDPVSFARTATLTALALGLLAFADAPWLTVGQRYVEGRAGERLVLLGIELNLVLVWAAGRFLLGWDRPLLASPGAAPWLAFAGLAPALVSVALAVWAKLRLGRWFSGVFAIKPGHPLVTDGPYAIVRHPIYTGVLGAVASAGVCWNSALTVGLAAALAIPLYFHTVFEELLFERHFGDAWRAYRARVPRLIPFTGGRNA